MMSPLTGFLVEMGLARCAGTSASVDSYRATSTVLNLGNQLFFGSLTVRILVPLITECQANGDDRTPRRLALSFGLFLSMLEAPILYLTLCKPSALIAVLAPGLRRYALGDSQFQLWGFGIALVPLLWGGILAAVLQAQEIFWVTALSQSFNNIAVIAFLFFTGAASTSLVYGNIVGIAAMFALHAFRVAGLPVTRNAIGWTSCLRLLRKAIFMSAPPLAATVPALVTSTILLRALSLQTRGTLAEFGYAGKPLLFVGLASNAFATVILPQLSKARFDDPARFVAFAKRLIRSALFLSAPLAFVAFALRRPLMTAFFGSPVMSNASLESAAGYFGVFLLGAPAAPLSAAMSQISSALYDPQGPALASVLAALFTFLTVPWLATKAGPTGIAAVISANGWLVCFWLAAWTAIVHRVRVWDGLGTFAMQVFGVSALAGFVAYGSYEVFIGQARYFNHGAIASLLLAGLAAGTTTFGLLALSGLPEARYVTAYVRWQLTRMGLPGVKRNA